MAAIRVFRTLFLSLILVAFAGAAMARTIIRDPDIEYALGELARPLINASGLSAGRIDILVILDDGMNAFVVDDRTIFIHSGLILRAESPEELQAVIAHEVAHIANGHISRRRGNAAAASRAALTGVALSVAAALAGEGQAAGAIATASGAGAMNTFLAHTRAEEAAADASGLRYMAEAGVDPAGAARMLEQFRGQEALSAARQSPYVRAHPLTRDRLRAVQGLAAGLKVTARDQSGARYWFERAKGKLSAFVRNPGWTLRQVGNSDSELAIMRRAVAYHRRPDTKKARAEIDRLAGLRPNDPFVHELRGQILLESRDFKGAVGAYGRAANLAPGNPLILAGYGRSLLATGQNGQALDVLVKAHARDPRDPQLLRDLAQAYANAGQTGMASVTTAERYTVIGRPKDAVIHAERAVGALPPGSPGYRRAQDILALAARQK